MMTNAMTTIMSTAPSTPPTTADVGNDEPKTHKIMQVLHTNKGQSQNT